MIMVAADKYHLRTHVYEDILSRQGAFQGADASREEVRDASNIFSKEFDMPPRKTYHAYVWQVLNHFNKAHPSRRK